MTKGRLNFFKATERSLGSSCPMIKGTKGMEDLATRGENLILSSKSRLSAEGLLTLIQLFFLHIRSIFGRGLKGIIAARWPDLAIVFLIKSMVSGCDNK